MIFEIKYMLPPHSSCKFEADCVKHGIQSILSAARYQGKKKVSLQSLQGWVRGVDLWRWRQWVKIRSFCPNTKRKYGKMCFFACSSAVNSPSGKILWQCRYAFRHRCFRNWISSTNIWPNHILRNMEPTLGNK